jgi:hypothetical protein
VNRMITGRRFGYYARTVFGPRAPRKNNIIVLLSKKPGTSN